MILELRVIIPGQEEKQFPLNQNRILLGSLLSNHVVLRAEGVEPIHALIEQNLDNNKWIIIDLFSESGVLLNGKKVDVDSALNINDELQIGQAKITVKKATIPAEVGGAVLGETQANLKAATTKNKQASADHSSNELPVDVDALSDNAPISGHSKAYFQQESEKDNESSYHNYNHVEEVQQPSSTKLEPKGERLFSPRKAVPSGNVLEVVAFWGDTVLEVEHFHRHIKGFESAVIGEKEEAHFLAAGEDRLGSYKLLEAGDGNYRVNLLKGMQARLRKDGKVAKVDGPKNITLSRRDLAYISYGPINYFAINIRPPKLVLPNSGPKDPFLLMLNMFFLIAYLAFVVPILMIGPVNLDKQKEDDPWAIVNLPEEKLRQLEPKIEKPKIEQTIAEVKTTPKVPPKPKVEPFKPAKPVETEKPKQTRPTPAVAPKDISVDPNPTQSVRPQGAPKSNTKAPQQNDSGMPSTGAKSPDFKLAGPQNNQPKGAAGGVKGSGNNQQGGRRKGNSTADYKGVEDVNNNQASGVNLSKLGLGAGMVRDVTGPGAVSVPFRSSAGGAGGGAGSAPKTYGLGGTGDTRSVGLAGSGTGINNFGSGAGGFGSGEGGKGGLGGVGLGRGTGDGRGRANVRIPEGDPVSSGGLTAQEIMAVIRANLNQIRHCYEQLLQRSPGVSGKISVRFVVGLDGNVTSANITDSSISDGGMQGCVTSRISRWNFPNPRGGQAVTINYPFSFAPQ